MQGWVVLALIVWGSGALVIVPRVSNDLGLLYMLAPLWAPLSLVAVLSIAVPVVTWWERLVERRRDASSQRRRQLP